MEILTTGNLGSYLKREVENKKSEYHAVCQQPHFRQTASWQRGGLQRK